MAYRGELENLRHRQNQPGFWEHPQQAQEQIQRAQQLANWIEPIEELLTDLEEIEELLALANSEDTQLIEELSEQLDKLEGRVQYFERHHLVLAGSDAHRDALLEIKPGAGGTEAQAWAEMLLDMYEAWAKRRGFTFEIVDLAAAEEAGIRGASVEVCGSNVYGLLRAETGVHRLTRVSPFDASSRKHTSFASVQIAPLIEEEIEIDIQPDELEVDTFRASGPGGQHVNKTESAVRIRHLPTGITVSCQKSRSQHQNREKALRMLRSRLYAHEQEKLEQKRQERLPDEEIGWGNQIRTYNLIGAERVKDHRTNLEVGSFEQVVEDGKLDEFIYTYLRQNPPSPA